MGRIYQQVFDHEPLLVRGAWASKASFMELAPKMRYLHIATHGRFLSDETLPDPSGKRGDGDDLFSMPARRTLGLAPSVFCGICLAGCNRFGGDLGNDGVVTAEEIQGMDLTACELAVLSACETNVGVIRPGQGIMSLQRALRMAGVRGSITSLWKVDDRATSLLFEEFYRLMWEERLNPPEALQRAQEHLRNSPALKEMPATMGDGNSEDRGVTKDGRRKGDDPPYAQPKHWAAFVYWGDVM